MKDNRNSTEFVTKELLIGYGRYQRILQHSPNPSIRSAAAQRREAAAEIVNLLGIMESGAYLDATDNDPSSDEIIALSREAAATQLDSEQVMTDKLMETFKAMMSRANGEHTSSFPMYVYIDTVTQDHVPPIHQERT